MAMTRGTAENNIILFISLDDMTKEALLRGAQFGAPLKAKALDWLNTEWTRFENMQATVPICRASRAGMMTSLPPNKTRVWTNGQAITHDGLDWTQAWPARLKRRGQVDAVGKITHGFSPAQAIQDACYTRFHSIPEQAIVEASIVSQSGITGTPGQVFEQVRLFPDATGSGSSAYARITLNAAGTGVAKVEFVEYLESGEIAPRYDIGIAGGNFAVGDTVSIGGLGYDPVTQLYDMPAARLTLEVTKVALFQQFSEKNAYGYGTFTLDAEVAPADQVQVNWIKNEVIPTILADNDRSFRAILCGFYGTHHPWMPEQRYLDMYPLADISIPTGYDTPSAYVLDFLEEYAATDLHGADKLEEAARYYLASVEQNLDRLGALINEFKQARYADGTSLWDRTTVVVWSDHSYQVGNQNSASLPSGIEAKNQPFGTATSCFCAVRIPGVGNGASIREPVSALDLGPTILAAAGVRIPTVMMGQSLLPAMRNPVTWTNSRAAVSCARANFSAVKAMDYSGSRIVFRLIRYFNGEEYLYNETADPLNKTSLHANPAYSAVLTAMQAAMNTELARWGKVSSGTTGDDLITAFASASLVGDEGDDTYIIGDSTTTITEAPGEGDDAILFQPSDLDDTTLTVPENVEHLHIGLVNTAAVITGNASGVEIVGKVASFTGGAGNDSVATSVGTGATLSGGGGADLMQGEDGADSLTGGTGNDTLQGDGGNDTISGGDDDDSIKGGAGADSLSGDAGNDTISGSSGNDSIYGGDGNDSIIGGADTGLI